MAFTAQEWTDRQAEFINRRDITDVTTGATSTVDVALAEGNVLVEGYEWSAANMNDLETRIKGSIGGNAVTFTLYAASWTGTSAPYSQTVSISGLGSTQNGFSQLAQNPTLAQSTADFKAKIRVNSQAAGQLTYYAYGTKPTVDLPMVATLLG